MSWVPRSSKHYAAGIYSRYSSIIFYRTNFYVHLFLITELNRRPHIRWYHTIVPCKCWGSGDEVAVGSVGPRDEDGKAAATSWYPPSGMFGPGKRSIGCSSGGVTSKPILPFKAILKAFCCCCCCWCCNNELKWDIPISSRLLLRRRDPTPLSPWRRELDRLNNISSTTLREFERPLKSVMIVGLSGSDKELALVVQRGGARGGAKLAPIVDPLLLETPWAWINACEQKLIFDLRRLLWRSNVFWAENGDGRTKYLKSNKHIMYILVLALPNKWPTDYRILTLYRPPASLGHS